MGKKAILTGEMMNVQKGEKFIEQGAFGNSFFVLLDGESVVTKKDNDGSIHTLTFLQAGEMFGEISQLTGQKRTASVTATQPTKALKIKWEHLYQLGKFHPRIALKLYRNLSGILGKRMARQANYSGHIRDELTGAITQFFLLEQIRIELDRAKRYQLPLCCIIINIEFLYQNKSEAFYLETSLQALTKIISKETRTVDIFARWQEQQFIIVMPQTTESEAKKVTERMQNAIERDNSKTIGRVHMTAGISVSKDEDTVETIIQRLTGHLDERTKDSKSIHISTVD